MWQTKLNLYACPLGKHVHCPPSARCWNDWTGRPSGPARLPPVASPLNPHSDIPSNHPAPGRPPSLTVERDKLPNPARLDRCRLRDIAVPGPLARADGARLLLPVRGHGAGVRAARRRVQHHQTVLHVGRAGGVGGVVRLARVAAAADGQTATGDRRQPFMTSSGHRRRPVRPDVAAT